MANYELPPSPVSSLPVSSSSPLPSFDEGTTTRPEVPTVWTTSATYALFVAFGIGSWTTVNGMYTELPLLVTQLPEKWRLASDISIIIQLANIGPLLFCWLRWRRLKQGLSEDRLLKVATYGVLMLGAGAMAALAFSWRLVVDFAGSKVSVSFYFFTFLAALADCTSSLLFWRFAASFRALHLSALSTGEGMSGAVTSLLVAIQNVSGDPRFPPSVYFALLAVCMCISGIAFSILQRSRLWNFEKSDKADALLEPTSSAVADRVTHPRRDAEVWALLALQMLLNALQNGVSVSCLALACKPYGRQVYQAAQTSALVVDPMAAALGFWISASSRALLPVAVAIVAVQTYVLVLSLKAVSPPWLHSGGGALLVFIVTLARALTSYSKMRVNLLLHQGPQAEKHLLWSGIAMQCGAFLGAVIMYFLVNWTPFFRGP